MREKVGKSRNTMFFQWLLAPQGRKVGSLKRRVRSQLARGEIKKLHAVVARSTFPSQNVKNTRVSDHFWRFRCRFASLHYITLHSTTLHSTTVHYITQHYNYNYTTTLHYTKLHYTKLHYTTLHYTTLHSWHSTTLHYTTLHYTTLHDTQWHCTTDRQVDS